MNPLDLHNTSFTIAKETTTDYMRRLDTNALIPKTHLEKQARPSIARVWKSLGNAARSRYLKEMPSRYARQLGKAPIGGGTEGKVFNAIVPGKKFHGDDLSQGNAVVKSFHDATYSGRMTQPPAEGATRDYMLGKMGHGDLSVKGRYDLMKELEPTGMFPKMYKPHERGYFMERLTPDPNTNNWLRWITNRKNATPYRNLRRIYSGNTEKDQRIGLSGRMYQQYHGMPERQFNTLRGPVLMDDVRLPTTWWQRVDNRDPLNVMRRIGPDGKPAEAVFSDPVFTIPRGTDGWAPSLLDRAKTLGSRAHWDIRKGFKFR